MNIYAINFKTLHFGNGAAIAIAANPNSAFQQLKSMGRLNGTPEEYLLVAVVQVDCTSSVDVPTLVYEDLQGLKIITGPKGDKGDPGFNDFLSVERLRNYLYKVTFSTIPADNGKDYNISASGCSSYVSNGKLYRNFDFGYTETASFMIRTKDFEGMSFIAPLKNTSLDATIIGQLPYHIVDGVNNNGIKVSTHVLFNDWEWTGCGDRSVPLTRLPYLVLSRVKSMATIVDDLSGILNNLTTSESLTNSGYLIQMLVTDGTTTYAIFPPTSNAQPYVLQNISSNPKLTNFRWLNRETVSATDSDIQLRPTGIERFNAMPCALEDLRFTKAYETPSRLTEFIGINHTTKESTDEELIAIYDMAHSLYENRTRDGQTWHTMHSVVYGDKIEELYIQENWNDNIISLSTKDLATILTGFVSKTGNELIDGIKTFNDAIKTNSIYIENIYSINGGRDIPIYSEADWTIDGNFEIGNSLKVYDFGAIVTPTSNLENELKKSELFIIEAPNMTPGDTLVLSNIIGYRFNDLMTICQNHQFRNVCFKIQGCETMAITCTIQSQDVIIFTVVESLNLYTITLDRTNDTISMSS